MNFSSFLINTLLTEANVLNLQVPLNGVSLVQFLDQNLADVPEASRAALKKKLTKLLVNDERYHTPVTELPNNAPDWAEKALEQGQPLVAFRPSAHLAAELEHIGHYIGALEADQAGNDPDKKAVATRELAGIARAENLDLIMQKSQEYFTRGTKNMVHSNEGTKVVMQLPTGFFWVLLESMDAYKREGKVLQNCIGTHWLPTKADRIYVLKTRQNESVVAIRVANDTDVQEVKGKNNKPPVARYMPSVAEFLNSKNWSLGYGGMSDVRLAGYVLVDKVLMTREEAIEKFVPDRNIIEVNGIKVGVVDMTGMNEQVRKLLYPNHGSGVDKTYELKISDGKSIILRAAKYRLVGLERPQHGYRDELSAEDNTRITQVITGLMKQKLIQDVSDELLSSMGLSAYVVKNGELVKKSNLSTKQIQGEEEVTKEQVVDAIRDWSRHHRANDGRNPLEDVVDYKIIPVDKKDQQNQYQKDRLAAHVMLKHKDGHTTMLELSRPTPESDKLHVGRTVPTASTINQYGSVLPREGIPIGTNGRSKGTIAKVVAHANETGTQIPMSYRIRGGIIGQPGSYQTFDTSDATTENGIPHYSFNELTDKTDKMIALATTIANTTSDGDTLVKKLDDAIGTTETQDTPHTTTGDDTTRRDVSKPLSDWAAAEFGKELPDDIYVFTSGSHRIPVFVKGNEIIRVGDRNYELEGYGARQKAMQRQLQQLIDATGLVPSKQIKQLSPELELADGKVGLRGDRETAERDERRKLRSGPEVIRFKNGASIREVTGRDAYDYLSATGHKTRKGDVYRVYGSDGRSIGMFSVEDGKVSNIHAGNSYDRNGHPSFASGSPIDRRKSKSSGITKYILGAAGALGLDTEGGAEVPILLPNKNAHKILQALSKGGVMSRTAAHKAAGASSAAMQGWDALATPQDRRLADAGFVNFTKSGRNINLNITERGRKALEALDKGSKVRAPVKPEAVVDGTPMAAPRVAPKPEPKPVAEPKAATPRATPAPAAGGEGDDDLGGGSKMDRAMRLWDKYVEDNGEAPRRGVFIDLMIDKLGMTKAGASTYAQTVKVRKAQAAGQVNERLSFIDFLMIVNE